MAIFTASTPCSACERAEKNPRTGIYQVGCRACDVRAIAQAPYHIRQQAFAQQPDAERAQFEADVMALFKHLQPVAG